jgi:hypothetical protein
VGKRGTGRENFFSCRPLVEESPDSEHLYRLDRRRNSNSNRARLNSTFRHANADQEDSGAIRLFMTIYVLAKIGDNMLEGFYKERG